MNGSFWFYLIARENPPQFKPQIKPFCWDAKYSGIKNYVGLNIIDNNLNL